MNPELCYVRTKERLNVLPPGRLKKNRGKFLVNTFPFFLFSGMNAIRFPITKAQANIGWLADAKGGGGGDKHKKGKMNITRVLRNCVS